MTNRISKSLGLGAAVLLVIGCLMILSRERELPAKELPVGKAMDQVYFASVEIAGRSFEARQDAPGMLTARGSLAIHLHELPSIRLRALDAATGKDLQQVVVRTAAGAGRGDVHVPGDEAVWSSLVVGQPSPLDLSPFHSSLSGQNVVTVVGAPGFAWKTIFVDPERDAELTVSLDPGAQVAVEFAGVSLGTQVQLMVLEGEGVSAELVTMREMELGVGVLLQGVPSGEYRFVAVRIAGDGIPGILGEVTCSVVAGQNPTVTVPCSPPPAVAAVPFSLTLQLPEAWGIAYLLGELDAHFEGMTLTTRKTGPETWLLESGEVTPGTHSLGLPQLGVFGYLTVPEQGLEGVILEVSKPAIVVLTTVDDVTGEPVAVPEVSWSSIPYLNTELPELGSVTGSISRKGAEESLELLVPIGQVGFFLSWDDYVVVETRHEIGPEGGSVELRLSQGCSLDVHFMEDGKPIAGDWSRIQGLKLEGPGKRRRSPATEFGWRLTMSKPGTYSVERPTSEEFSFTGPDQVQILEKGTGKLEIEVVAQSKPLKSGEQ